jgi:hypothetical protein
LNTRSILTLHFATCKERKSKLALELQPEVTFIGTLNPFRGHPAHNINRYQKIEFPSTLQATWCPGDYNNIFCREHHEAQKGILCKDQPPQVVVTIT